MITNAIRKTIDNSVLCWLATASKEGIPSVSPKELFLPWKDQFLVIANLASPRSVNNIRENHHVCVSFIDVFVQKGYQLYGTAEVIDRDHQQFQELLFTILPKVGNRFVIVSLLLVQILTVKEILAPSYQFFPQTTEHDQIESAKQTYLARFNKTKHNK